ncbi:alpha/beta hydrolase family protein [Aliikangiella sp. IMCC44359]|uniref:alpha/beta hydrolase family protein n=1 Tax=Aliikangiella sp. IMCC44359 TaxID=3459125 RepID=UPI00403AE5DA
MLYAKKLIISLFLVFLFNFEKVSANNIPLKEFIQWPAYKSVKLSPSGRVLALQRNFGGDFKIKYIDIDSRKILSSHATQYKASDIFFEWLDSDSVIILQRIPPGGRKLILYNLKTNKTKTLLSTYAKGRISYIGASENVKSIYVSGGGFNEVEYSSSKWNSVFRVDLDSGEIEEWVNNLWEIDRWYSDANASYWVGYQYHDKVSSIYSYNKKNDKIKKIFKSEEYYYPEFTPLVVNSKNKKLLAITNEKSDTNSIYDFDLESGKKSGVFFEDSHFDISNNTLKSHDNSKLFGVFYSKEKGESVYFVDELNKLNRQMKKIFKDETVNIVDFSLNFNRIILYTFGDKNPGKYYLYDQKQDKLSLIGENIKLTYKESLADMVPIQFDTRDDKLIHGYITLPKNNKKSNKLPMVVFPHGGPYARDEWKYNSYVQFFASRGYAVLQVNFRSSTGYGAKHFKGGIKQYGLAPNDDLIDGVKWSISKYGIDTNRICIVGASYGGFATFGAMTREPSLFRCGISIAGFVDLEKMLEDDKEKDFYVFETLMMGDPETEIDVVRKNSPLYSLNKLNSPVLIIHGKLDQRVKFHHAKQIEKKLKLLNKEYETFYVRDEGHTFIKKRNRIKLLKKIESYLDKNIGNKGG